MSEKQNHSPKYPVQTLEKALEIIEILAGEEAGDGLGISDLNRKLGIGKSTIHRILDTMVAYRYVEKTPDKNKYRLSWRFFQLGSAIPRQRNLANLDMSILEELCDKYGETVNVGVRVDDGVVIASKVDPETTLKASLHVGQREPLHATALGKVLLSEVETAKVEDLLKDQEFKAYTNNSIISLGGFLEELQKVRRQGYAIDNEEFCFGLSCIAMPIRDHKNEIVAAVSVSGPSFRMTFNKIMDIQQNLNTACCQLSKYLGNSKGCQEAANE